MCSEKKHNFISNWLEWFKQHKNFRKYLILTGVYAAVAFTLVFISCYLINRSIVMDSRPTVTTVTQNSDNMLYGVKIDFGGEKYSTLLSDVPQDVLDLSFSFDDKYCTYIYNGEIVIIDIEENKIVETIAEKAAITNACLMSNRNIIIYITHDTAKGNIALYTYNIDSKSKTQQKEMTVSKDTSIINLGYSTATSIVFFETRSNSGAKARDTINYFDIMKRLHYERLYLTQKVIMLNKMVKFYYENNDNILYSQFKAVSGIENTKIKLLGCDLNDNIYMQSLDNSNTLFIMDDSGNIKTTELEDLYFYKTYSNQDGFFLIYNDYLMNIASDAQTKIHYDNKLHFLGMGGNKIYFRSLNGDIVAIDKTT